MFTTKLRIQAFLGVVLIFSIACSFFAKTVEVVATGSPNGSPTPTTGSQNDGSPTPTSGSPNGSPPPTTGSLKASVISPISVQLSWDPVDGASQYAVEWTFGDLDTTTIAVLPGEATAYEVFPTLPDTELSYRVTAITSSGNQEVGTATLTTPGEIPNPLVVTVKLEEPEPITFDFPTPDPNQDPSTIDPIEFFPPGFDPENPDYSLFGGEPKTVSADIGPEGGKVEATGANGVKYTLTVPPGATDIPITFGLTPVQSIEGLPLSGGLIGAVNVEPEGIEFDPPLILEITPPEAAVLVAQDQIVMGFAVTPENDGKEFYFVPRHANLSESASSARGGGLARMASYTENQASSGAGIAARGGGVYGVGAGTSGEVQSTVTNYPPSRTENRITSKMAAEEAEVDEELAPLPPKTPQARAGLAVWIEALDVNVDFMQAVIDFQAYLDSGGREYYSERIWKALVDKAKQMFDREKGKCFTKNSFVAAGVAQRMTSAGKGTFWANFANRFIKKYGQKSLDDARSLAKRCKVELLIKSTMDYMPVEDDSLKFTADIRLAPLRIRYETNQKSEAYGPYLVGTGTIYYSNVLWKVAGCKEIILKPKDTEYLRMSFKPVFNEAGDLSNFQVIKFGGGGGAFTLTKICDGAANTTFQRMPSGSLWGGVFVDSVRGEVAFTGFSVSNPPPSSGVIATKEFSGTTTTLGGGSVTQSTTFKMVMGGK